MASGPCILVLVVESAEWARQTASGPGPLKEEDREEVEWSSRLPFREESPNSCLGPFVKSLRGARICKDGPNGKGGGSSIGAYEDG
jgi:hypothetical protein